MAVSEHERRKREVADAKAWQAAHNEEGPDSGQRGGIIGFVRRYWWAVVAVLALVAIARIARKFG